jgi:TetR/AcrR family transcriptional regulator
MDRLEASLKQSLRIAASEGGLAPGQDPGAAANLVLGYVQGRWQQFVKSGFRRLPLEHLEVQWACLMRGISTAS